MNKVTVWLIWGTPPQKPGLYSLWPLKIVVVVREQSISEYRSKLLCQRIKYCIPTITHTHTHTCHTVYTHTYIHTTMPYNNLLYNTGCSESHCALTYLLTYMFQYRTQEVNMNNNYKLCWKWPLLASIQIIIRKVHSDFPNIVYFTHWVV